MRKPAYPCAHALVVLSLLGLSGCYSSVTVDSFDEKAIAIDWVEPPCAEPGSEAGYIEGTGFGAENVTITVAGIEAEVLAATGMDASFVVPEGIPPGPIEVVVENPGGRLATIQWDVCEVECDPIDCDDDNECTTDTCDTSDGTCINDAVEDGTSCDFGGVDGVCEAGLCRERSWGTPVLAGPEVAPPPVRPANFDPTTGDTVYIEIDNNGDVASYRCPQTGPCGAPVVLQRTGLPPELEELQRPQLVVNPDGGVTAVWADDDGYRRGSVVASAIYPPGGPWSAPQKSSCFEAPEIFNESLLIDASGTALLFCRGDYSFFRWSLQVNGKTLVPSSLPPPNDHVPTGASFVNVFAGPTGGAMAVWSQTIFDGQSYPTVLLGSVNVAPGLWVLEPSVLEGGTGHAVTTGPDGYATVVWSEGPIWAVRYEPDGTRGIPVQISSGVGSAPQVWTEADGNVTALWSENGESWTARFE